MPSTHRHRPGDRRAFLKAAVPAGLGITSALASWAHAVPPASEKVVCAVIGVHGRGRHYSGALAGRYQPTRDQNRPGNTSPHKEPVELTAPIRARVGTLGPSRASSPCPAACLIDRAPRQP